MNSFIKYLQSYFIGDYENKRTFYLIFQSLGAIYFISFFPLLWDVTILLGENGLLPIKRFSGILKNQFSSFSEGLFKLPSLFWFGQSDEFIEIVILLGLVLSFGMILRRGNSISLFLLFFIQLSFSNFGQIFFGYGWEILLVEMTFLLFLARPSLKRRLESKDSFGIDLGMISLRWLLFKLMLGAGLIKIRGDQCWRDITCLSTHFETQPIPNPLSYYFHYLPSSILQGGVWFNHLVELIVPFFFFGPRPLRIIAGILTFIFQSSIFVSGNFLWLNLFTIILCFSLFDDQFLNNFIPQKWKISEIQRPSSNFEWRVFKQDYRKVIILVFFTTYGVQNYKIVENLWGPRQVMNGSYGRWKIVNTYGMFGSIGKERNEVVISGTSDKTLSSKTEWKEYRFPCAPGEVSQRPCFLAPFHSRVDWQIWFAGMSSFENNLWLINLTQKVLDGDKKAVSLFKFNPFKQSSPQFLKMDLYQYRFDQNKGETGNWWVRQKRRDYLPPLSKDDKVLKNYLKQKGF